MSSLASVLAGADRRTLAALVTHLSGDPNVISDLGDWHNILRVAEEVLPAYISGAKTVNPPTDEVALAAMKLATASRTNSARVSPDYIPIMREITDFGPPVPTPAMEAPHDFRIVILGAGVTGILAGISLAKRGMTNFTILEEASGPGGTWRLNSYPGAGVDTPSMLYSFNFDQDPGWSEHFCHQPELLRYLDGVIANCELTSHLRCGVKVEAMSWNDLTSVWELDFSCDDGSRERITANAVITALGLLHQAKIPDIVGVEEFGGPAFHSANWNHNVDLSGKRVAVVGTGASGIQIVSAIAPITDRVFVYERTPHWIQSHSDYGKALVSKERELFEIPGYRPWYRFRQFWTFGDSAFETIRVDPEWPHPERSISAENDRYRDRLTEYLMSQVGHRPDIVEKVLPKYPPWGKRMLIDCGWYKALLRDDVELITTPIERVTSEGIVTSEGTQVVDVIVYATGFYADRGLWPMKVTGTGGADITTQQDEQPEAYVGIALPNCPNLFVTSGPYGNNGHGGNGFFNANCQVNYVMASLQAMFDNQWSRFEVRQEAVRNWVDQASAAVAQTVFSISGVNNWFRGNRDHVTTLHGKRLVEFWKDTRGPCLEDYFGS
jgi:4-hydroxyacetophenone monooxygenase